MSNEMQNINTSLVKLEEQFIKLTNIDTWNKEKSFAVQLLSKNTTLQKADVRSIMSAIMNVANIGLSLNPASKLAYLVPRFMGGGRIEVCLEASYQGLVKLITDSGSAKNVYCHLVYEGDEFQESLGTSVEIVHRPKRKSDVIQLVYAVAVLSDGSKQVEVMTLKEINDIREKSESFKAYKSKKINSCVWVDHYEEMARKTVIRRLCKYLPKTNMWDKINTAIKIDESDYVISESQIDYIESLLKHANIDHDQRGQIERNLHSYSSYDAKKCIEMLKENQLNPIDSGFNYTQTDIKNKLEDEIPRRATD
jgi:phage RecT family recombinase